MEIKLNKGEARNICDTDTLISVIVPVYNVESYLERCVDSILAQTHKNLEVILIDDGSPDGCPAICDEYAKKDSRVVVIHKENGGQGSARNAGLDVCRGDYIAFVDSDDRIEPDMYRAMLEKMIETDSDMAVCGTKCSNGEIWKLSHGGEVLDRKELFIACVSYCDFHYVIWDKLYRRKIWCGETPLRFPENIIHEDVYILCDIVDKCERTVFLPETYYNYLIDRYGSTTNTEYFPKKLNLIIAARHFCEVYREKMPDLYCVAALLAAEFTVNTMVALVKNPKYYKFRKLYRQMKTILKEEYENASPYISEKTLFRENVENAVKNPRQFFLLNFLKEMKYIHYDRLKDDLLKGEGK